MKRLIVIRHGKSTWELNVRDHDRVLLQRGIDDAHLIGDHLKNTGILPDLVWSSSAARALQTATLITEKWDYSLELLKIKRALYTFDASELQSIVSSCDDSIETLTIVSHNHGITDFVNFTGSTRFDNVPTTGAVVIEFDVDKWSEIATGTTVFKLFPKDLK